MKEKMKTKEGEEEYSKHHSSWVMKGQENDQEKHKWREQMAIACGMNGRLNVCLLKLIHRDGVNIVNWKPVKVTQYKSVHHVVLLHIAIYS